MAKKKSKIWELNLYDLLETVSTSTEAEIKKAYRKKALKCHPDKNPDNPKAAELFHELSEALEILTDPKAREVYDRTLKGKELAKERTRVLDSKRRKLKEDLEKREQAAKDAAALARTSKGSATDEEQLQKEIDRLKKEGSRALREEQELIRQQILREQQGKVSYLQEIAKEDNGELDSNKPRFKVKWGSSVVYDYDGLINIFGKYGKVTNLVVLKKSALVEFSSQADADKAYDTEIDKSDSNFKFEWVTKVSSSKPPSQANSTSTNGCNTSSNPGNAPKPSNPTQSFADFEAMILGKLSAAAAAQKDQQSLSTL